jgi:hypothetical protein
VLAARVPVELEGLVTLPTAKNLRAKIAQVEAEKAPAALKAQTLADAEKQAFLDRISKPSGLSDDQILEKASHIVTRSIENGLTSVQILRFANHLCSENGPAIDQAEDGWQRTLTGIPKELWEIHERQLKPRSYHMHCEIIDRPGGPRGDVPVFLSWN